MNKEDKNVVIGELKEKFANNLNFYLADTSNLSVAKVNQIRRKCFEQGIEFKVAKNSLIKKALEASNGDFTPLYDVLKGSSSLMFGSTATGPAKLIKELRRTGEKPILKGAYIDASIFIGDHELDTLLKLKSKEQLIGEVIGLLQSPIKRVLSQLQSGGAILAGLVKTLQEKKEADQ